MAEDYARRVADALIEQLRQGTAPWQQPWEPGQQFLPYNPTTGSPYRGMNAMWLLAAGQEQGYADPRWMTYKQAQSVDAQVRKGEKGTAIQYWKWRGDEPVRAEDGRPVVGENGKPVTRTVDYDRPRVFTAIVFNAAQIDGLAPEPDRKATPEWERHARAEAILTNSGAEIRHQHGNAAYYEPRADRITLPERAQFPAADRYYATALHELGHWTGHESRLNRDLAHPFGSEGYAREELRAEIASLMVGGQLELGHDVGQHAAYVDHWIKALQDDPREIFRAAADAEKIAGMLRGFERVQTVDQALDRTPPAAATRAVDGPVPLDMAAEFAADDHVEVAYAAAMTAAFRNPDEARAAVAVVALPLGAGGIERAASTLREAPQSYGALQETPTARDAAAHAADLSTRMFAPDRLFRNELRDAFEDPVAARHALDAAVADVGLGQALAALRETPTVYGALQRDPALAGHVDPHAPVPPTVPLDEAAARGAAGRAAWYGAHVLTAARVAELDPLAPTVPVADAIPVPLDVALARDVDRFADRTAARLATERPELAAAPRGQLADATAAETTRTYLDDGLQDRVSVLTYQWLDVELEPEQEAAFAAQDRQWQAGDRAELDAALREDLGEYLTRVGDDLTTRDALVPRGSESYEAAILDSAARYRGALADRVTGHVEQWLAHARAASDVAPQAAPDPVRAPRPVAVEEISVNTRQPASSPLVDDVSVPRFAVHISGIDAEERHVLVAAAPTGQVAAADLDDRGLTAARTLANRGFLAAVAHESADPVVGAPDPVAWTLTTAARDAILVRPDGLTAAEALRAPALTLGTYHALTRQQSQASQEPMMAATTSLVRDMANTPPATPAPARTYLAVPFAEKDEAKALGARWDKEAKSWYVPPDVDRAPLARWLPDRTPAVAMRDPQAEFADALHTAGLRLDGAPVMDGQLRRVPVEGDRAGERSGAYVGHLDGHPAGYVENFKTGLKSNWKSQQPVAQVSAGDRARLAEEAAAHRAARATARGEQAHAVAVAVQAVWDAAQPATGDHAYLAAKGVQAYGVRVAQTPALQLGPWAPDAVSREKSGGRAGRPAVGRPRRPARPRAHRGRAARGRAGHRRGRPQELPARRPSRGRVPPHRRPRGTRAAHGGRGLRDGGHAARAHGGARRGRVPRGQPGAGRARAARRPPRPTDPRRGRQRSPQAA